MTPPQFLARIVSRQYRPKALAKRSEEGVEELKAELFFSVVRRQEDLMVLAEKVYEANKDVRGRTHRREDSRDM
jgi:hypothetical protein